MSVITLPQLVVGGRKWTAWKRVSVQYGAEQASRAFAFTSTDAGTFADRWSFMPGTEVSVQESGELLVKGFIDKMTPSFDAKNHHVELSGRSKSKDTIDSSVEHHKGEFRKKSILDIAKELDKQGVGFASKLAAADLPKLDVFRINPHETVFQAVERIARKQQLLLIGQADGSIKIDKGGDKIVNAPLIEGKNILAGSATFDESDKHSDYKVKGQKVFGSNKSALQITASAKDTSVKRQRTKTIAHDTATDKDTAKKRAEAHRDRQQGRSVSANIRVLGWRDDKGKLFEPNTIIPVYAPTLKLNMLMLIKSVNLTMDESGSFAALELAHPKALNSKATTGSRTDSVWQPGF